MTTTTKELVLVAWLPLILLAILIASSNALLHRVLLREEQSDPYAQSLTFFGIGGTIALLFATLHPGGFQYRLSAAQLLLFLPLTACATIGPVLYFTALQRVEASETTIVYQAGHKFWTVLGAFVFLGEAFTVNKVLGAGAVVLGIAIALSGRHTFRLSRGVLLIVAATVFYSAMDLLSFFLDRSIDPISLIVYVCYLPVLALLVTRPKTLRQLRFYGTRRRAACITVLGMNDTLGTLCVFYAYRIGRNAAQIDPLLGMTTILSVVLAIVLLRERRHLRGKLLGALVTVAGALLVL
ncbi:MAG TPA: DMT family transporter [Dehalococcoidia bacterium]|nr:DMT family transporter [Dehalococcoidia bacterium]